MNGLLLPFFFDLQKVVKPLVPAVTKGLDFLASVNGVVSSAMSGSGPSCFAIFSNLSDAKNALDNNQDKLDSLGLEAWCCAFRSEGVSLIN